MTSSNVEITVSISSPKHGQYRNAAWLQKRTSIVMRHAHSHDTICGVQIQDFCDQPMRVEMTVLQTNVRVGFDGRYDTSRVPPFDSEAYDRDSAFRVAAGFSVYSDVLSLRKVVE
ncbi:hypothetical protein HG531_009198 [Fusarium graminearum]|nr:hypothetical protein HG531_009198 [Fusarium graminearum]